MQKDNIIKEIYNRFSAMPEALWEKYPNYLVFRNVQNKKWFAIIMDVSKKCLGLGGDKRVDIINIKLSPFDVDILQHQKGFLPAYHMNKTHWVTIVLDNTLQTDFIMELIEQSYDTIRPKITKKQS